MVLHYEIIRLCLSDRYIKKTPDALGFSKLHAFFDILLFFYFISYKLCRLEHFITDISIHETLREYVMSLHNFKIFLT